MNKFQKFIAKIFRIPLLTDMAIKNEAVAKIYIDHSQPNMPLSLGISEERSNEIIKQVEKLCGDNENYTYVIAALLNYSRNNQELVYGIWCTNRYKRLSGLGGGLIEMIIGKISG